MKMIKGMVEWKEGRVVMDILRNGSEWWSEMMRVKVKEKRELMKNGCNEVVSRNIKVIGRRKQKGSGGD